MISYLEANDIKSMTKYTTSGSYLNIVSGFNYQGVDVLVATESLLKSKKLLEEYNADNDDDKDDLAEGQNDYHRRKQILARWWLVLGLIIPMGLVIISNIVGIFTD